MEQWKLLCEHDRSLSSWNSFEFLISSRYLNSNAFDCPTVHSCYSETVYLGGKKKKLAVEVIISLDICM